MKNISVMSEDECANDILYYAAEGSLVVRYILQNGKSPHGLAPFLVADKDGVTPIHIAACGNGKILQPL
ncbi:hypothetical protein NECAME_05464 [Necator americanus]|uniref:Ankyrin repeat protein n=1 Tax=Necator americanus TaxID=51031 RepID=W2SGL6_NECAM|nr:hypothetical protein NECAME_05464 [Necator americanus]ETN68740.1 hypothetical protein NECAME_05464 [Necator americanus]